MKNKNVKITIRFINIMQRHSGQGREVELEVPCDAEHAVEYILTKYQIPWKGNLEKFVRVFINRELLLVFKNSGKLLQEGDTISFIPMSGGG